MADLISAAQALEIIAANTAPGPRFNCPLAQAQNHVLAEDVHARLSLPPFDVSAMDGYAVIGEALNQGVKLDLIGEAQAGQKFAGTIQKHQAVRIFTGAALPSGADHIIMQEHAELSGTTVRLNAAPSPASHIRKAGIDFKKGDKILSKGTRLDGFALSLAAAANHARLSVYKKPVVALLANGDELTEPGQDGGPDSIINSNPYGLAALIEDWGGQAVTADISKDNPDAIKTQIKSCSDADILLPIGGASVGDYDYMQSTFTALGYRAHFSKIAVKPGKPVWFGKLAKQLVLGLPGNPASALVCAHIFLKPMIQQLCGDKTLPSYLQARTTQDLPASTWRREYIRAHAHIDEAGTLRVTPYPRQDSSLITPFITANCFLVRTPKQAAVRTGEIVEIQIIKSLT